MSPARRAAARTSKARRADQCGFASGGAARECHRSIDSMRKGMSPELRGKIDALIAYEQK
jgi:hypothetical protein